jgi:hypothetical protein
MRRLIIRSFIRTGLTLQDSNRLLRFVSHEVGFACEKSELKIESLFFELLKNFYATDKLLIEKVAISKVIKCSLELTVMPCANQM